MRILLNHNDAPGTPVGPATHNGADAQFELGEQLKIRGDASDYFFAVVVGNGAARIVPATEPLDLSA